MPKNKAKAIITKNIEQFPVFFDRKDVYASNGLNMIVGKISFAIELGLIDIDEMDYFIDRVFKKFDELE